MCYDCALYTNTDMWLYSKKLDDKNVTNLPHISFLVKKVSFEIKI